MVPGVAYHAPMATSRPSSRTPGVSALATALDRIGDRWSPRLIEALLAGPLRFGELQEAATGIAPNILAERLRRLEADGLLVGSAYAERPPRFEYRLTAEGRALAGALRLLADWGARHGGAGTDARDVPRHATCGSALEAHWYCPTCDAIVVGEEQDETRHV